MDAEKECRERKRERERERVRVRGEGVVFFQSSNLLNLFFPRNVAAVSKLLIAIGKVEPMGREGSAELSAGAGRRGGG